ncbi:hypothetical protein Barb6_03813 [Bacteroidales bacterium Barb6]|nr:hypothetical protein Barb6_03813 [Bacteroidales bacterium Barb6]
MKECLDMTKSKAAAMPKRRTAIDVQPTKYLEPDADLARAISIDELRAGIKEDIRRMYREEE